jgi:uncharacterized protein YqhQ
MNASAAPEPKVRLGGMALRNGLLVHGPTHWAASIRDEAGQIAVASGPKPRLRGADRIPGVRGLARLAEAFAVLPLVKRALPAARMPFEDAAVLGTMGAAALAGALVRRRGRGRVLPETAAAGLGLAPALLALRSGELAAYHGVEHKAIAAYEQDAADAAAAAKEHERCGSHLVAPMIASNVAGAAVLRRLVASPGPLAGGAVALAATGAAVEVFAWCERHAETAAARAIRRPGYELQRAVGTREPTPEQLEVGRAALNEILRLEGAAGPTAAPAKSSAEGDSLEPPLPLR